MTFNDNAIMPTITYGTIILTPPVAKKVADPYRVYHRKDDGKLGQVNVSGEGTDVADAILEVKELLVGSGVGYNEPVLALVQGGKQ